MSSTNNSNTENVSLCPDNVTKVTLEIENFPNLVAGESWTNFALSNNNKIHFTLVCQSDFYCFGFNYVLVYLHMDHCDNEEENVNVRYRISILNSNEDQFETKEGVNKFSLFNADRFGGYLMVLRDNLLKHENGLLLNGKLTICCEVEELTAISKTVSICAELSDFCSLSQDYHKLLECGKMADAVLVVGKKELSIHKIILSARSPVFAAMFEHSSTKEAQENRVEITDVDSEVLEEMLKFIYTGKVEFLDRLASELLIAADKYQMDSLKSLCEQFLCTVITAESVSDLLLLADMHHADKLNTKCVDFIAENGAEVMPSEEWKKVFAKPNLVSKVIERMSLKISDYKNKCK